jgi:hypothetical protein
MRVWLGGNEWYLCDADDPNDSPYREFQGSEIHALQLLGQFRENGPAMGALHKFWSATSADRLTDDELLRQISWWLGNGAIRARQPIPPMEGGVAGETGKATAFPLQSRRQQPVVDSGPAPEGPLLPADTDAAAIAAALKEAAKTGMPFCEECLKAQLAQQSASADR